METSEKAFAEALHQAHADLLKDLWQLEESVGRGSKEGPPQLSTRLGKVRTHLTEHFRFEEQGGYMAPLLKEEPRFEPVVQALLHEHRQLAQALDEIVQEVSAAPSLRDDLREKVRAWVRHVRQHEARENSLVQEVYYSSGAAGD
jgi:iron-sulfur cluster repair protein YtfE (RIC family)